MNVRELPAALDDVKAAVAYLERQRSGTGGRLVRAYEYIVEQIERFPQFYPLVDDDHPPHEVRNAVLDPFDYRVIYLVRPNEAVVLAVSHTSRRPYHWHRRLADPAL